MTDKIDDGYLFSAGFRRAFSWLAIWLMLGASALIVFFKFT